MSMDRSHYWKQLSRAVRWRLPEADAKDVLMDYKEILSQHSDDQGDTLVQSIGEPSQVARTLTQRKDYYRWLLEFGVLVVCLLIPETMLLWNHFSQHSIPVLYFIFLFGFTVSLILFHPRRGAKTELLHSRKLLILLLILMAVTVITGIFLAGLFAQHWKFVPLSQYGVIGHWSLLLTGTIAAIFSLCGLVQARLIDRRWCALYVLGLSILLVCAALGAILASQELLSMETFNAMLIYPAILCVAGILGTGVSLC